MVERAGDVEEMEEDTEAPERSSDIDKLQEHGIQVTDIKKLKTAGIQTVMSIAMHTKKQLSAIKGLSEQKIEKILAAVNKVESFGFKTGTDILIKRKKMIRISTGATSLDQLLGGGIETCSITEAFGEFRTGKTMLAHTLCVTAQLPTDQGGGNGKVIYIDTEGTFRPDRIVSIAERFGVDATAVLDNIVYARAYTSEHQHELLKLAAAKMMEDHFALIIIDSCTALFRVDYQGRGQLADRQQKLGMFLSHLTKLADEFNIAIYLTNQVMAVPDGSPATANERRPVGGHVMAHSCCTRLHLKKGREDQRVCKIHDSPCLPEAEAIYRLTEEGVKGADDK